MKLQFNFLTKKGVANTRSSYKPNDQTWAYSNRKTQLGEHISSRILEGVGRSMWNWMDGHCRLLLCWGQRTNGRWRPENQSSLSLSRGEDGWRVIWRPEGLLITTKAKRTAAAAATRVQLVTLTKLSAVNNGPRASYVYTSIMRLESASLYAGSKCDRFADCMTMMRDCKVDNRSITFFFLWSFDEEESLYFFFL